MTDAGRIDTATATADDRPLLVSGLEALARIPLLQSALDRRRGLHTGGVVAGYRGSPLAALDKLLAAKATEFAEAGVHVVPALNEETAVGIVQGAQEAGDSADRTVDGAFGFWYGKAPGLARSMDALRHSVLVGAHRQGGAVLWIGDDPMAISSRYSKTSERLLCDLQIPVLVPTTPQEAVDLSIFAVALSRMSGAWVAILLESDIVDSRAPVDFSVDRQIALLPGDHDAGVALSRNTFAATAEAYHRDQRLPRAQRLLNHAFAFPRETRALRYVIVAAGQAANMARQGLERFEARHPDHAGAVKLVTLPCIWPIAAEALTARVAPAAHVLVAENGSRFLSDVLRAAFFGVPDAPAIIESLWGHLAPAALIGASPGTADVARALEAVFGLAPLQSPLANRPVAERLPFFCPGCPSNHSTQVPDGARSLGGIGCHLMSAVVPEAAGDGIPQMGGEGANWLGRAPFVRVQHAFQDLGDGTYAHSGSLAVRAAVAAAATITFKLLVNGAVAMTGGQPVEGAPDALSIARQLAAEGVGTIWIVADRMSLLRRWRFPRRCRFARRRDLHAVQDRLRRTTGVSALLYVEDCAIWGRQRARNDTRIVIDTDVCEGCDDCIAKSRCIAIDRIDTPLGPKRQISAHLCTQDLTCLDAECPAFVVQRRIGMVDVDAAAPPYAPVSLRRFAGTLPLDIVIAGLGGTGVVSAGRRLAEAAARAGLAVTSYSNPGLSQRGALVTSHVRLDGPNAGSPDCGRLPGGTATLLISTDPLTATQKSVMDLLAEREALVAVIGGYPLQQRDGLFANGDIPNTARLARSAVSQLRDRAATVFQVDVRESAGEDYSTMLLGSALAYGLLPLQRHDFAPSIVASLDQGGEATRRSASAQDSVGPASAVELDERFSEYGNAVRLRERWRRLADDVSAALHPDAASLRLQVQHAHWRLLMPKDTIETARLLLRRGQSAGWRDRSYLLRPGPRSLFRNKLACPATATRIALRAVAASRHLRGTVIDPTSLTAAGRSAAAVLAAFEHEVRTVLTLEAEHRERALMRVVDRAVSVRGFGTLRRTTEQAYLHAIPLQTDQAAR